MTLIPFRNVYVSGSVVVAVAIIFPLFIPVSCRSTADQSCGDVISIASVGRKARAATTFFETIFRSVGFGRLDATAFDLPSLGQSASSSLETAERQPP